MMIALIQLITAFSLSFLSDYQGVYEPIETLDLHSLSYSSESELSYTPKEKAIQILENKCNVCHNKRNKRRVFTIENMDPWADDIYKQVFLKKRMPKGKNIKLTSQEYQILLTWISTTKNI